jgi:hypothetical protein
MHTHTQTTSERMPREPKHTHDHDNSIDTQDGKRHGVLKTTRRVNAAWGAASFGALGSEHTTIGCRQWIC